MFLEGLYKDELSDGIQVWMVVNGQLFRNDMKDLLR